MRFLRVEIITSWFYISVVPEYDKNDAVIKQDQLGDVNSKAISKKIIVGDDCIYVVITFFPLLSKPVYESINKRMAVAENFTWIRQMKVANRLLYTFTDMD